MDLHLRDLVSMYEQRLDEADAVIAHARDLVAHSKQLEKLRAVLAPSRTDGPCPDPSNRVPPRE